MKMLGGALMGVAVIAVGILAGTYLVSKVTTSGG